MLYVIKMAGIKKQKDYIYQIVDKKQFERLLKNKKLIIEMVGELCLTLA